MTNIRHEMTELHYPDEVTCEEFVQILKANFDAFIANMNHLNIPKHQYIESWFETFGAWTEIIP